MPKNSFFLPLHQSQWKTFLGFLSRSFWNQCPRSAERAQRPLPGVPQPVLGLWVPLVLARETSSHPSCPLTFVPAASTALCSPPPYSFQQAQLGFFKNRSCLQRRPFSFPCVCGIKAVCGAQGLSPFSLWNLLDLWQAGSQ